MTVTQAIGTAIGFIAAPLHSAVSFILDPLLGLPPLLSVILVAVSAATIATLLTKYLTNQTLMKALKEEIDSLQKQLRNLEQSPDELAKIQGRFAEVNMKYMLQSMRVAIYTIIPMMLLLNWFGAHYAYVPLIPGNEFTVTVQTQHDINGTIRVQSIEPSGLSPVGGREQAVVNKEARFGFRPEQEGRYTIIFSLNDTNVSRDVLVTKEPRYEPAVKKYDGYIKTVIVNYKKLIILSVGFWDWLGWVGVYIITSIFVSLALKKFLKVY